MNIKRFFFIFALIIQCSLLSAADFTICSYNCGGLSDHYDFLRAACMEKLMQERSVVDQDTLELHEKIQNTALIRLFAQDPKQQKKAANEWNKQGYELLSKQITRGPLEEESQHKEWFEKANAMITSYKTRPVIIHDESLNATLDAMNLTEARRDMAKEIFAEKLRYDIICLQEANYLDESLFPANYQVLLSEGSPLVTGIAWNTDRFELICFIRYVLDRGIVVYLRDKETLKTVAVGSGHLTGCNPYYTVNNDSAQGDFELRALLDVVTTIDADIMLVGMDSNVTAMHPRLEILKEEGYRLDVEHALEPTCTSPYYVLNQRIDWIALRGIGKIINIPVEEVELNSIKTNFSDHKPIAARIKF